MKHIKSFNESVIENDIQSLKDIFIHLKDDGYKVEYFSKKFVNDNGILVPSIGVKITNPTVVNQIINLTSYDVICSLKEAVSLMQSLDYKYQARYEEHGWRPNRFYIYLDKRPLAYKSIDENLPSPHTIYLEFYML